MELHQLSSLVDRLFQGLSDALTKVVTPTGRDIVIGSSQAELRQAILADLVDIIPIVGDVSNAMRIQDAARRGGDFPSKRIPLQVVDLVVGGVPVIGELFDALTPTNTINWLEAKGISPTDVKAVFNQLRIEFGKGPPGS